MYLLFTRFLGDDRLRLLPLHPWLAQPRRLGASHSLMRWERESTFRHWIRNVLFNETTLPFINAASHMPGIIVSTPDSVSNAENSQRIMSVGSTVTVIEAPRVVYSEPVPLNPLCVGIIHLCAQTAVGVFVESVGKLVRRFRHKSDKIELADGNGDIINRTYRVDVIDNFKVGEFLSFNDEQWVVNRLDISGSNGCCVILSKIPNVSDYSVNPTCVEFNEVGKKLGKVLPVDDTSAVIVQHNFPIDRIVDRNLNFVCASGTRFSGLCLGHKAVKAVESRSKTKMLRIGASDNGGVYVACRAKRLGRISSSFDPSMVVQDVEFREVPSNPDKVQLVKCVGTTQVQKPQVSTVPLFDIGFMCLLALSTFVFAKLAAFRGSETAHDLRGLSLKSKLRHFSNPLNWF